MASVDQLIQGCKDRDPHLMELFYKRFAPEMWVVCLRYTRNQMMAEDVMQEGFMRVYKVIDQYSGKGSIEGWMRTTFVRTAVNYYKKYFRHEKTEQELNYESHTADQQHEYPTDKLMGDQLLELLDTLPDGYRIVFNLYAIEGYSHKEIAEMLGCTEGTSRSQYSRARQHLQRKVKELYAIDSSKKISVEKDK
jgi:RNA polymerase sigma-70 factor (ECF subfamily)